MKPGDVALSLWPPAASASAAEVDHLILAFTGLTLVLVVPVFVGITWFAFKYRDGRPADRSHRERGNELLELSWMLIPFALTLLFFIWGAWIYIVQKNPPKDAMHITAVGRQWMWKFQHPGGQMEIDNLHVPMGQPVVIRMTSQDVIHSIYIPALRVQMEALPDRETEIWFNADHAGTYHLFCAEYCGTDHSKMVGLLTIMEPPAYEAWLAEAGSDRSLAAQGKRAFETYGCSGCHNPRSTVHAPDLAGLYGKPVHLEDGRVITADDVYIRDKILYPNQTKVVGYKQVMPSFAGVIPENDLIPLVAYIKSLGETSSRKETP